MHNNYYFLRQLSQSLEKILTGTVVSECFSQNKDELIIRFETLSDPFFIKASLLASFACLSFPENFHRARKNSVDLFEQLIGQCVQGVRQFKNERSFALQFPNEVFLLFKMHGNRANIILFKKNKTVGLFKNSLTGDEGITVDSINREIDWTEERFLASQEKLKENYFTFGKIVWHYLSENGFDKKSVAQKWEAIVELRKTLENPVFYIAEINHSTVLSLLPTGTVLKKQDDPIRAVTEFFHTYTQTHAFKQEKIAALSALKTKLTNSRAYYEKTSAKLHEIASTKHYKLWADLIMANLHTLKLGEELVTLSNFHDENLPTEIKLKKDLSPQKNAELFYKKSKNQQIEVQRLWQILEEKKKEIDITEEKIQATEVITDLKSLRKVVQHSGMVLKEKQEPRPYHEFEFNGYKIWVGKNAKANDELTLKYSYKEDLWLHTKDVAGSHVIIKHQSGKNFPKDVIERAAQLASYYSKRKNESLCPVAFTPKKYVRKRKGDLPGTVVVEREEVILVEPRL